MGAQILTYHQVTGLLRTGDRVTGVRVFDHKAAQQYDIHAQVVVNAAGTLGPANC
ncbi:Anaerobic glycerol-3-phosphate dehydrogenase subunit A [Serratia fonticola]|uniref:Anaerobic glycerol-3-phosphate dehydrogenase subunit A n=1 Tax=Serratia fonticola TaxID=47917 RepID=A0A4U9U8N4_SERFO|nr:Anaerobic glycerol-3-phosphate dehydrogenase subunit A [Serratia fonticola]